VVHAWQRHLLQAGRVDAMLGDLLDRLDEVGLSDEAHVVVASDHGVAFEPGDLMRHFSDTNQAHVAFVPLFVKSPSADGGDGVDDPVELLDILPTVLDMLDADTEHEFDGRSLFDDRAGGALRRLQSLGVERWLDADPGDVADVVSRRVDLLGQGGWDEVWRAGPRDRLLGRSLDDLAGEIDEAATVDLRDPSRFDDVDPDGDWVLSLVTARLTAEEPLRDPVDVAVAVNGRVAATGQTHDHDGARAEISVLAPPEAFTPGGNTVEVVPLPWSPRRARVLAHVAQGRGPLSSRTSPSPRSAAAPALDML
jgi:hypothetical protein